MFLISKRSKKKEICLYVDELQRLLLRNTYPKLIRFHFERKSTGNDFFYSEYIML